jgi:heme iron utilization protein
MVAIPPPAASWQARAILRTTLKGSLGTIDRTTGAPYVSLVTMATDIDGSPVLLLSDLARHTMNLKADPRASLLLDTTDTLGDPASGARLSLGGLLGTTTEPLVRWRYLNRHPEASMTASFGDFSFWRMQIETGHMIAGFGRIHSLVAGELQLEASLVAGLKGHQAAVTTEVATLPIASSRALLDLALSAIPSSVPIAHALTLEWLPTGVDPEGLDFRSGKLTTRLPFERVAMNIVDVRNLLSQLGSGTSEH